MTSERLLNMSIEVLYLQKTYTLLPPKQIYGYAPDLWHVSQIFPIVCCLLIITGEIEGYVVT